MLSIVSLEWGILKMKKKKQIVVVGVLVLCMNGCSLGANDTVKQIRELESKYEEAKDEIPAAKKGDYETLGESVQALVDLTDNAKEELSSKEQKEQAETLVTQLTEELNQMYGLDKEEESDLDENHVKFSLTFENDSQMDVAAIALKDPQNEKEIKLGTFEKGKKVDSTVVVSVEDMHVTWYLYDAAEKIILEYTSSLEDAKKGINVYYTDDGVYTENW